jgi:hypothetical protein
MILYLILYNMFAFNHSVIDDASSGSMFCSFRFRQRVRAALKLAALFAVVIFLRLNCSISTGHLRHVQMKDNTFSYLSALHNTVATFEFAVEKPVLISLIDGMFVTR